MKQKSVILFVMLAAAAFILFPLVSVIRSANLKKHGIFIESTVTGISSKKGLATVTVTFKTADGNLVTAKASKRYYVSKGDKVMIYYDPESPQKIDFGDTIGYNMRGVIAGGFLFLFMMYYFIRYSNTDKANRRLVKSGMKIAAEFVSVTRNEKYRMGEKNPWVINCRWTDIRNNKEYYFKSKDYTIDPAPYLEGRNFIDIYIDPSDPVKYYMDNSFMPEGNNTIG